MVLLSSVKISRVPTYSGYCSCFQNFVYRGITCFAPPFQACSTIHPTTMSQSLPHSHYSCGLGSSDFARHYSRNHCCFLFLRVLRCFSSPGSPHTPIYSMHDNAILLALSSLIRISADYKIFAPPRSFSQLVTSFFGAMYQGILRKPFVAWSSLSCLLVSSFKKILYSYSANFNCSIKSLKIAFNVFRINQISFTLIWKIFCLSYSSLFQQK